MASQGARLWLDTSSVNAAIVNAYNTACERYYKSLENKSKSKIDDGINGWSSLPLGVYKVSPISLAKAIKNAEELEGMRNSHLR